MGNGMANSPESFFKPLSRRERLAASTAGWIGFVLSLIVYWLTVASSASYWDCPEYILTAVRLEVGHPPGNPFWTLFHRIVTILSGVRHAALAINLMSGLFTAIAVALLARMVCVLSGRALLCRGRKITTFGSVIGGVVGALMFAWCDSVWFSAVEAEVYAMSLFFTALTLWLMIRWSMMADGQSGPKTLLLVAWLTGVSLGVHQLNLLSLPVLALIYMWRRSPGRVSPWRVVAMLLFSLIVVAIILKGMMPGTVWTASCFELIAVNLFRLPFGSGVIIYLVLLAGSAVLTLVLLGHASESYAGGIEMARTFRFLLSLALLVFLLFGGFFFSAKSGAVALVVSAVVVWLLLWSPWRPTLHRVMMAIWAAVLILAGYSSLMLIPIRAAAAPYVDTGFPSDPFSLYSYIEREQYGGAPLIYGHTPYSKPMAMEEWGADSVPQYTRLALKKGHPVWRRAMQGGRLSPRSGFLTAEDSVANVRRLADGGDAYVLSDYRYTRVTTPELDMWFPRITSSSPSDIDAYRSWIGMDTSNMVRVAITDAFDSAGNAVNRLDLKGERTAKWSHRPTYLQNLEYFAGYQVAYMYLRYLLWNFSGRQNDMTSSGEADHGNFLTGISFADDAMLGSQELLPPEATRDNRGHNVYWMIPLLLCLFGAVVITMSGRKGRRVSFGVLMLFLLTGVAIVVYLNQTVGEPRERDYTFLGSYFAFAAWGGFGAAWIVAFCSRRRLTAWIAAIVVMSVPVLMLSRNYDDHDRSRRHAATDFAINTLESLQPDAIIFVDGDNYTFPLWYVQEVLGVRRDVTVVSISYLALPQYVASLKIPGEKSLPVPMTAREEDLLYGRYALTRFPSAAADTIVPEADDFLRLLYSSQSGRSVLPASVVRVGIGPDTVTLNLREVVKESGGSLFGQRQLALLDIVATDSRLASPRPIYWISHLPSRSYGGFRPHTRPGLFARSLLVADTASLPASTMLSNMRWGGFSSDKPAYADPTVQGLVSFQRLALIGEGRRRLDAGKPDDALCLAMAVADSLPGEASPYGYSSVGGKAIWDGVELALLLVDAGKASGDSVAVERGRSILREELKKVEQWRSWRNSLSPRMRDAVSFRTLRFLRLDTDSLARHAGLKPLSL